MRAGLIMALVLACIASLGAAPPKEVKHFTLKITPDDPEAVDYYVALPDKYDPAKRYPLLYCVPGSGMNSGDAEKNQAVNYVSSFCEREISRNFIVYSIWFTDKNGTYPHWKSPRAEQAAKLALDHMLAAYSVDRGRVFMEFFSGGGAFAKTYPLQTYAKEAPVTLAGLLFTSANYHGGRAATACVNCDTMVFIEVGELECPVKGFSVDLHIEARGWELLFKEKVDYSEFHMIPNQAHDISKEAHVKIQAFFKQGLEKIDARQAAAAVKNLPQAEKFLKGRQFGQVFNLIEGALGAQGTDPVLPRAQAIARALDAARLRLVAEYYDSLAADPVKAFAALFALESMFKGHAIATWATATTLTAYKDPPTTKSVAKGKAGAKDVTARETAAIDAALGGGAAAGKGPQG